MHDPAKKNRRKETNATQQTSLESIRELQKRQRPECRALRGGSSDVKHPRASSTCLTHVKHPHVLDSVTRPRSEGQSLLEAGVVRGSAGVVSGPTWTSKGRSQRALSQGSFQIQLLLRLWPPCWRTGCSLWVSWRTLPTGQARLGLSLFFSGGAFEHYESGHLGSNHFLKPITL